MRNPTALTHVMKSGNLDVSRAIAMTIDADGMIILMSMLSNMYPDGHLAVVREYACNARDSHIEARAGRPIEISLPGALNPTFQVQDYGLGLSHDEIIDVYAKYGASTKRDTNEQVGAFGIGAKSAFTVGNSFTVTGVKDGERTIALFAINKIGVPTVQILYRGETDEPNGVLVDVAVENPSAIQKAAERLFPFWEKGSVLIDGDAPDCVWAKADKVAEGVYIDLEANFQPYTSDNRFTLVMGGVPYKVPTSLWYGISGQAHALYQNVLRSTVAVYLDVPIGSVDVAPNREDLRDTPKTKATAKRMMELFSNSLASWVTQKIEGATTIWEAAKAYRTINAKLNTKIALESVYWKGQALGKQVVTLGTSVFVRRDTRGYRGPGFTMGRKDAWAGHINTDDYDSAIFITDTPGDKANTVRAYARVFAQATPYRNIVVLHAPSFKEGWFSVGPGADSDVPWMTFTDYWAKGKELRKANAGPAGTRTKTQYDTWMEGDAQWEPRTIADIKDLDPGSVAWIPHNDRHSVLNTSDYVKEIWGANPDLLIVAKTSQQKFETLEKGLPEITAWYALVTRAAEAAFAKLTPEDLKLLEVQASEGEKNLSSLSFVRKHRSKITNGALLKHVADFDKATALTDTQRDRVCYVIDVYRRAGETIPYRDKTPQAQFFKDHFPLLYGSLAHEWGLGRTLGENNLIEALIDYVNSVKL